MGISSPCVWMAIRCAALVLYTSACEVDDLSDVRSGVFSGFTLV